MVYTIVYGYKVYMSQDETELIKVLRFIDVDRPADFLRSAKENCGETLSTFTTKEEPVLVQAFRL